jgi:hypothetical protein
MRRSQRFGNSLKELPQMPAPLSSAPAQGFGAASVPQAARGPEPMTGDGDTGMGALDDEGEVIKSMSAISVCLAHCKRYLIGHVGDPALHSMFYWKRARVKGRGAVQLRE